MCTKMNVAVLSIIPNLLQELRIVAPNVRFQEVLSASDENLKQSEIVIADFNLIAPHIYNLPKLKWLQGTWAGLDTIMPYINKPLPFLVTRFSNHYFGQMMAEYVLTYIVAHERDLFTVNENQKVQNWSHDGKIHQYRSISDLTIGILGIGNIGSWVGKCLHMFGAKVLGYGRKPALDQSRDINFISEYFTRQGLSQFLKSSDYIVNVLPTTPETTGLLNGNILENCKEKQSVFINIGRGTIVNENDLVAALNKGWLSAAILDVFQEEPLPNNSPLWKMSQVKITPHVSGVSRSKHIAEQFHENLELYMSNKKIPATVNLETGY